MNEWMDEWITYNLFIKVSLGRSGVESSKGGVVGVLQRWGGGVIIEALSLKSKCAVCQANKFYLQMLNPVFILDDLLWSNKQ